MQYCGNAARDSHTDGRDHDTCRLQATSNAKCNNDFRLQKAANYLCKQLFPTRARKISPHAVYGVGVDNGGHNDSTTPNHGIFFIKNGVVVQ